MDLHELLQQARSVRGIPFSDLALPFSSLGDLLAEQTRRTPEKTWLIFYDENGSRSELSYAAFTKLVRRTAGFLLESGIGKGDRVATIANNHSDTVIQYFATWWIGATVVPVNVGEDDERIAYILENSQAKLAFVRGEYLERIAGIAARTGLAMQMTFCIGNSDEQNSFSAILAADEYDAPTPATDLMNHECLIVYTSGTTGNPKGVLLAHGNLLADAAGITAWHGITADARMMCVLPIHHVNGTVVTLVSPMFAGSSVV
ncbi:MAG: class I adenylate-forming enzyme family protein, partial [Bacteroidota bacterium]